MPHTHIQDKPEERFSVLFFAIVIISSLLLSFTCVAYFAPHVWIDEVRSGLLPLAVAFLSAHMLSAFVEFFFHRYVLHAPVIPLFARFYRQHTLHHSLTYIRQPRAGTGVENKFPILEAKQHEASFFPAYSFIVFSLIATPLFLLIKWIWPQVPVFLPGYTAIAWGLTLYELLHALEHKPVEKWQPYLEHPKFGSFWRKVYSFHLRHHADTLSNESISGFFGIPIPDFIFRTWINPQTLYENNTFVERKEFQPPTPVFFIGWLDEWAKLTVKMHRQKATV